MKKPNYHFRRTKSIKWEGGSKNKALCVSPVLNTTKGVDRPPKSLLPLSPGPTPSLTPYESQLVPAQRQDKESVTCFHSPEAVGDPIKSCLNFLNVKPLINFY